MSRNGNIHLPFSVIKLWFRLGHFSLQNTKNFECVSPSNFRTENSKQLFERDLALSDCVAKNLGFSETDLDVHIKMQKSIPSLSIVTYKICQCVLQEIQSASKKYTKLMERN